MQLDVLKLWISNYMDTFVTTVNLIFIEHPDHRIHILLATLMVLLMSIFIRTRRLQKQLNDIDKRNTITLLSIQHYCTSINRAVNEGIEISKAIAKENTAKNNEVLKRIGLAHMRVKNAYVGIFKHLEFKRIRRAPKPKTPEQQAEYQKEKAEHDALVKEAINEMMKTEFDH